MFQLSEDLRSVERTAKSDEARSRYCTEHPSQETKDLLVRMFGGGATTNSLVEDREGRFVNLTHITLNNPNFSGLLNVPYFHLTLYKAILGPIFSTVVKSVGSL